MPEEVVNKTEYPDSYEFGQAGNRVKVYFNAGNVDEAKSRIDNVFAIMRHKESLEAKA